MFLEEEGIVASAEATQLEQLVLLMAIRHELKRIDPANHNWWVEQYKEQISIVCRADTPAGRRMGEIAQELGWDPIYKGRRL